MDFRGWSSLVNQLGMEDSSRRDRARMYWSLICLQAHKVHLQRDFHALIDSPCYTKKRHGRDLMKPTRDQFALWKKVRDGMFSRRAFQQRMQPMAATSTPRPSGSAPNWPTKNLQGMRGLRLKDRELTKSSIRSLVACAPEWACTFDLLCYQASGDEKLDAAEGHELEAIRLAPESGMRRGMLACIFQRMQRLEDAIPAARQG